MSLNICFIGAGNLATHLSKELQKRGFHITQVYSRRKKSAQTLADILRTDYTNSLEDVTKSADIYFVALNDSVFDEVLSKIEFNNQIIVHCSGSLPLSVLSKYSNKTGVFYPLQTFSKGKNISFKSIPVFIESNGLQTEKIVLSLAKSVSGTVQVLNSEKRKKLHISAVFACNFVNHFYAISSEILKHEDISFDVLKPLILETAQKVQSIDPKCAQTGPAVRFDKNIISSHLHDLQNFPDYKELYESISKHIFEYHNNL